MKFKMDCLQLHNMYLFYNTEIALVFTEMELIKYNKQIKTIDDIENVSFKLEVYDIEEITKDNLVLGKELFELDVIESNNLLTLRNNIKELIHSDAKKNGIRIAFGRDLYLYNKKAGDVNLSYINDYYNLIKVQNKYEVFYKLCLIAKKTKEDTPKLIKDKYLEGNEIVLYHLKAKELKDLYNGITQMLEDNIE